MRPKRLQRLTISNAGGFEEINLLTLREGVTRNQQLELRMMTIALAALPSRRLTEMTWRLHMPIELVSVC